MLNEFQLVLSEFQPILSELTQGEMLPLRHPSDT